MLTIKPTTLNQWVWNETEKKLENPRFGYIQLVDVFSGEKALYQQPVWAETRGEIDIIIDVEYRIAFVEQQRHVVIPTELLEEWKAAPDIFKTRAGIVQFELPRGFSEGILLEGQEEVRVHVANPLKIGHINANTSLFATSPAVFVARALPSPTDISPDPTEKIRSVVWLTKEEVSHLDTMCGFTMSALWLFRHWATLRREESCPSIPKHVIDYYRVMGEML